MRLVLTLCVVVTMSLVGTVHGARKNTTNCVKLNQEADEAFQAILWIGDRRQQVPRSTAEMDKHCDDLKESVKAFRAYGKCVKNFPKQIFSIIASNTRRTMKLRCDAESTKQDFLRVTTCYTDDTKRRLDLHMDRMAVFTNFVASDAIEKDKKLPWMCCGYMYSGNATTVDLAKDCGQETLDYTQRIMRSLFSDVMDLTCGRYSSMGNCKQLLPESEVKYEEIVAIKDLKSTTSLWLPLLSITRSLEEA